MIEWQRSGPEPGKDHSGMLYHTAGGIATITINRPEVRHAFQKHIPDFAQFPRRP